MDRAQADFAYMRDQPGSLKSRKDWWEDSSKCGEKKLMLLYMTYGKVCGLNSSEIEVLLAVLL